MAYANINGANTGSIIPGGPTPAGVVPPNTYTGPINNSINNTQQGADLVNANRDQAAKMGITLPGSTYTPPTNAAPTSTGTPSAPSTPTSTTTSTSTQTDAQKQLDQAQADYQLHAQQAIDTITNIQNGTTPLSAGEQAQIDGLKAQFNTLIQQQQVVNQGATGTAQIRGYQQGAGEYDPTFQVKHIASIVSAGQQKIADYEIKMASAVASLTQSFRDNDIAAVKDAWGIYEKASKQRTDQLQKTVDDANQAIKDAQAAQKQAEKDYYDRVEKPIDDIAKDAAKNGAPASVVDAIRNSGDVGQAIRAAGDSLITATGDMGAYLFSMRQAQRNGQSFSDYETWQKALDEQKLATEISKIQMTEGIKFQYDLALEKAKQKLADAPNPDYHGEFAATVKLAAQAGSTNAQRKQISSDLQDFIAEGDYKSAYTQILSSASAKLTGANASNFQQQQQSYESLKDMRDVLQEYKAMGGDTNIFKGGADKVQTKIGVLATDPKYAAIATRLNSAFQQYRQNMTGAAFGVKESAEYASVLPSAGNTFSLNMAKLDGAEAYLNSVIESTIKNTVGQGGIYIKQYAEAGGATELKQQQTQEKMSTFRSTSPENEAMVQEIHQLYPDWSMDQVAEAVGI